MASSLLEDLSLVKVRPRILTEIIENATSTIQNERQNGRIKGGKVNSSAVELDSIPKELVLVGDIHGDLQSLLWILKEIDFEKSLTNPANKLIFLGDYIDRGTNSIGVLYVVCYLKQKFPSSVVLMRGNHEAPMEFPFSSHDLPVKLTQMYGHEMAKFIYGNNIIPLFQLLSLIVLIPNQLLIVHGGLPTGDDLIKLLPRNQPGAAIQGQLLNSMEEILWSDPMEHIGKGLDWEYSRRGYGKHFGIAVTKKWLSASGGKLVVRGHEPCEGFKVNHQGLVLTLFSCKEAYPGFQAAYIKITKDQLLNLHNAADFVPYINKIPKLPELL
jgi:hypothetical protein